MTLSRNAAEELQRLASAGFDTVGIATEAAAKAVSDEAFMLWRIHVGATLSAISQQLLLPIWRRHPELAPTGEVRDRWTDLCLPVDVAMQGKALVAQLRVLADQMEVASGGEVVIDAGIAAIRTRIQEFEEYLDLVLSTDEGA